MKTFLAAFLLVLFAMPLAAIRTDCGHFSEICSLTCQDLIEAYENQINACANGAPGTGPVPSWCEWNAGTPSNPVTQTMSCTLVGCVVSGKLKCGSAANQKPNVPNFPQGQTNGLHCPMQDGKIPAVVVHGDNGVCEYESGLFIGWQCDAAGTGVDVVFGQHFGGGPFPAWP